VPFVVFSSRAQDLEAPQWEELLRKKWAVAVRAIAKGPKPVKPKPNKVVVPDIKLSSRVASAVLEMASNTISIVPCPAARDGEDGVGAGVEVGDEVSASPTPWTEMSEQDIGSLWEAMVAAQRTADEEDDKVGIEGKASAMEVIFSPPRPRALSPHPAPPLLDARAKSPARMMTHNVPLALNPPASPSEIHPRAADKADGTEVEGRIDQDS